MSKPDTSFRLPPRPTASQQDVEAFLNNAPDQRAASSAPAPAAAAAAEVDVETRMPWEGLAESRRSPVQPMRLNESEQAMLEFVTKNKPGVRSKHSYLLAALQEQLRADIKALTGEDVTFREDG
ncbi:hypothetical protein ACW0US_17930 [Xanthomonas euvesicatoria]